jgi:hypothetical protein
MPRHVPIALLAVLLAAPARADEPDSKPVNEKIKEVAGTAEFLRSVPKHFAILQGLDRSRGRVKLLLEGETQPREWPLAPDAEIKRFGWWGRLYQFQPGDRVWVWLQLDRVKQPVAVSMLADESSEVDIHGADLTIEAVAPETVTLKHSLGGMKRTLQTAKAEVFRGKNKTAVKDLKAGDKVYVQSAGDHARLILDAAAFEARRAEQKAALRQRWLDDGLPGTVTFLHRFSGEMEMSLDHEAMRWGRALKLGDKVTIPAEPPIPAVVKHVKPWRERTLVRLVVHGADQGDLSLGQRVHLKVPAPSAEVEMAVLPPDVDQSRTKPERIEWFLASIYCSCKVKGDGCTGHFYTLASCNPNGCGMPNHVRQIVAEMIDKGMTDRQIFEQLLKDQGPDLLRPHLLP